MKDIVSEPEIENDLQPLSVKMPRHIVEKIDELIRKNEYPNRSEAIRIAIRDRFKQMNGKY